MQEAQDNSSCSSSSSPLPSYSSACQFVTSIDNCYNYHHNQPIQSEPCTKSLQPEEGSPRDITGGNRIYPSLLYMSASLPSSQQSISSIREPPPSLNSLPKQSIQQLSIFHDSSDANQFQMSEDITVNEFLQELSYNTKPQQQQQQQQPPIQLQYAQQPNSHFTPGLAFVLQRSKSYQLSLQQQQQQQQYLGNDEYQQQEVIQKTQEIYRGKLNLEKQQNCSVNDSTASRVLKEISQQIDQLFPKQSHFLTRSHLMNKPAYSKKEELATDAIATVATVLPLVNKLKAVSSNSNLEKLHQKGNQNSEDVQTPISPPVPSSLIPAIAIYSQSMKQQLQHSQQSNAIQQRIKLKPQTVGNCRHHAKLSSKINQPKPNPEQEANPMAVFDSLDLILQKSTVTSPSYTKRYPTIDSDFLGLYNVNRKSNYIKQKFLQQQQLQQQQQQIEQVEQLPRQQQQSQYYSSTINSSFKIKPYQTLHHRSKQTIQADHPIAIEDSSKSPLTSTPQSCLSTPKAAARQIAKLSLSNRQSAFQKRRLSSLNQATQLEIVPQIQVSELLFANKQRFDKVNPVTTPTSLSNSLASRCWQIFKLNEKQQIAMQNSNLQTEMKRIDELHSRNDKAIADFIDVQLQLMQIRNQSKQLSVGL